MKLLCALIVTAWVGFNPAVTGAQAFEAIAVNGSLKSFNLYAENFSAVDQAGALSSDRFRLDLTGRLADRFDLEFSLDQQLLWASRPGVAALADTTLNRRLDLEKSRDTSDRFGTLLQVDRLNVHGEFGRVQWTVGRQAVGFGRISLFSPLDIIAPFPPDAIDVDVRPGADAVKATGYFGMAGQLGGVVVFGPEKDQNSYLVTLGENYKNIDLVALTGRLRGRSMAGIGLAGEIGKLGLKAELSWYRGVDVMQAQGDLYDDFRIAALEGWYRFDNGLVLIGEYLFNGIGTDDPDKYPQVAASAPIVEGLSYLLGRQYLLLGPSYQLHPLVTASGLMIYNIEDRSCLTRPQLAVSLADNLQLDLFWAVTVGKKLHTDPAFQLPVVRSEFGSVGDSGGLLVRWYF